MKIKEQTLYDISSDKFKYLKKDETRFAHRVDINELNKRLNENRKSNFYTTILFVIFCLSLLIIISFIGLKF